MGVTLRGQFGNSWQNLKCTYHLTQQFYFQGFTEMPAYKKERCRRVFPTAMFIITKELKQSKAYCALLIYQYSAILSTHEKV